MPRQVREKSESGHYHIILRGINRQNIFEDSEDRKKLLDIIKNVKKDTGFKLHAYCLMSNHVHLLIEDVNDCLSLFMKKIALNYAIYFNKRYDRTGHLFQDRFKSTAINDDKYYLTVLRYIHNNPVKAGLAAIAEYRWSSYRDYIYGDGITDTVMALDLLGGVDRFVDFNAADDETQIIDKEISDQEVIDKIKKKISAVNISHMCKPDRDEILRDLKGAGFKIRHIAAATGISESIIARA